MNKVKLIIFLLCCAALVYSTIGLTLAFSDEPILIYNGTSKEFNLLNTENTDLFKEFKGVVPGDKIKQEILFKTEKLQTPVNLYLRAENADSIQIPDEISINVYQGDKLLSRSSLNDTGNLTNDIHLYKFKTDGDLSLSVVLDVPTSVGNEISDMQKEIKWIFTVQEDDSAGVPQIPETGDNNNVAFYMAVMIISVTILILLYLSRKRNLKND